MNKPYLLHACLYFNCFHLFYRSPLFLERLSWPTFENFLLLITLDEATKEFVNFIIKDRNHKNITRYSSHAL